MDFQFRLPISVTDRREAIISLRLRRRGSKIARSQFNRPNSPPARISASVGQPITTLEEEDGDSGCRLCRSPSESTSNSVHVLQPPRVYHETNSYQRTQYHLHHPSTSPEPADLPAPIHSIAARCCAFASALFLGRFGRILEQECTVYGVSS